MLVTVHMFKESYGDMDDNKQFQEKKKTIEGRSQHWFLGFVLLQKVREMSILQFHNIKKNTFKCILYIGKHRPSVRGCCEGKKKYYNLFSTIIIIIVIRPYITFRKGSANL